MIPYSGFDSWAVSAFFAIATYKILGKSVYVTIVSLSLQFCVKLCHLNIRYEFLAVMLWKFLVNRNKCEGWEHQAQR